MSSIKDSEIRKNIIDSFIEKKGPTFSDEIELLREKHSKLSYQKLSLELALENKTKSIGERCCTFDIQVALKSLILQAVAEIGLYNDSEIVVNPSMKDGEFKCCDAMRLAKLNNKLPKEIAEKIIEALPKPSFVETFTMSLPGFINVNLSKLFMQRYICDIVINGVKPIGYPKKKVIVELSSPNIAKEMHVGHLRSTIIGDTLARLYEFLGCEVLRPSHIGDWGTQFGMLIAYLERENTVSTLQYSHIGDLQTFYRASKKMFDQDPEFKIRAHEMVVRLQQGDPKVREIWKMICDLSLKEFHKIYDRLGVKLYEEGESFFQSRMNGIVKELKKKDIVTYEDGCQIIYMKELGLPPLYLVKSDGGYTYATSDLATLKFRLSEIKVDSTFYVVDRGQADHFRSIFAVGQKIGWYDPTVTHIEHISFGVVLGEDRKKFKTRSGDTIRLVDLLDEGVERAKKKIRAKDWSEEEIQTTAEAIACSCIRYADLSHSRELDYVFSFDKMLDDRGNTAIYLLYALTRIKSILRKTKLTEEQIVEYAEKTLLGEEEFVLTNDAEIVLLRKLITFSISMRRILKESAPHLLCDFLYDVTVKFNDFYERCHCTVKGENGELKLNMNRIVLCYSVLRVLTFGFDIIGISSKIDRM